MDKVFCIGFQKTGTTSIAVALEILGFKVAPELWRCIDANDYEPPLTYALILAMAHEQVPQYSAFADNPWPLLWRELDESYSDAKFILMTRSEQAWYKSLRRMFRYYRSPLQDFIYGGTYPEDDETGYLRRFRQHNTEVLEHFKAKPHQLLELSMDKGPGWEPLCAFLGQRIPDEPFPHKNTAIERNRQLKWHWLRLMRFIKKTSKYGHGKQYE